MLEFLAARAIPGVESVEDDRYRRSVRIGDRTGFISAHVEGNAVMCEASLSLTPAVMPLVSRVRRLFDLDARPAIISAHLARDTRLAKLVRRAPGLRLPGAFDPFEMSVRAILGQQVSVRAASTLAGRMAARFGEPISTPFPEVFVLFPAPEALAKNGANPGIPKSRAHAIASLARNAGVLASVDPAVAIEKLRALPGIGDWTAQYIAMRALGWPDAFPATDLAIKKALGNNSKKRAEAWRPWRAYAVMHLWRNHGSQRHRA